MKVYPRVLKQLYTLTKRCKESLQRDKPIYFSIKLLISKIILSKTTKKFTSFFRCSVTTIYPILIYQNLSVYKHVPNLPVASCYTSYPTHGSNGSNKL